MHNSDDFFSMTNYVNFHANNNYTKDTVIIMIVVILCTQIIEKEKVCNRNETKLNNNNLANKSIQSQKRIVFDGMSCIPNFLLKKKRR